MVVGLAGDQPDDIEVHVGQNRIGLWRLIAPPIKGRASGLGLKAAGIGVGSGRQLHAPTPDGCNAVVLVVRQTAHLQDKHIVGRLSVMEVSRRHLGRYCAPPPASRHRLPSSQAMPFAEHHRRRVCAP